MPVQEILKYQETFFLQFKKREFIEIKTESNKMRKVSRMLNESNCWYFKRTNKTHNLIKYLISTTNLIKKIRESKNMKNWG